MFTVGSRGGYLSSETLRRAMSSASVASPSSSAAAAALASAGNNDSTTAETGTKKKQPLGVLKSVAFSLRRHRKVSCIVLFNDFIRQRRRSICVMTVPCF